MRPRKLNSLASSSLLSLPPCPGCPLLLARTPLAGPRTTGSERSRVRYGPHRPRRYWRDSGRRLRTESYYSCAWRLWPRERRLRASCPVGRRAARYPEGARCSRCHAACSGRRCCSRRRRCQRRPPDRGRMCRAGSARNAPEVPWYTGTSLAGWLTPCVCGTR